LYKFFVHVRHPGYRLVVKADVLLLWLLGVPIPVIILL